MEKRDMRNILVMCRVVLVLWLCCEATQAAELLQIKPESGSIKFVGSKDDGSHKGGFKKFSGTVELVPDKLEMSQVTVEIETGSIWSDNPKLTEHLSNQDFFHIDKFPKSTFRSDALRDAKPADKKQPGAEKATHVLSGQLTLLGVSKIVELPVTIKLSDETFALEGTYILDRARFGMTYAIPKVHKDAVVEFSLKLPRK
jgi:polyisoprenoid-binding protein YceI